MVMLRKDKGAMALIFDALVFLTIISIVGASLMGAIYAKETDPNTDRYIDLVHEVMLSCTFEGEGIESLMTLQDAAVHSIRTGDASLSCKVSSQMGGILDSYLSPLYSYNYSIEVDGSRITFGDKALVSSDDIIVSSIMLNNSGARFVLSVAFA